MLDDIRITKEADLFDELGLCQSERVLMMKLPKVSEYIIDLKEELTEANKLRFIMKGKKEKINCCIVEIDPKTRERIAIYRSITEASRAVNVSAGSIYDALDNPRRKSAGSVWKRVPNWKICNSCGFSGEARANFHVSRTWESGKVTYKGECKLCISKKLRIKRKAKK